ncbi:MAG: F0F1 ATP synthase subunit gamma [Proteobacteria bacterium]|nr:F0F1 ATP synthase subunit gamma [Pseudomonadota bacterium]
MSERLADVSTRIATTRQLGSVIGALRAIAAARSREARMRLTAIQAYAQTIAGAIGEALALLPPYESPSAVPPSNGAAPATLCIALCAEQGFAGSFNERVLDAADAVAAGARFLIGGRGLSVQRMRGSEPDWSAPMIAHPDQVPALAGRIADALYARLDDAAIARVALVYAVPQAASFSVVRRWLLPFDYARFPVASRRFPPRIDLPPRELTARLALEYVFAELCEALLLSFAAENQARVQAMITAHANVAHKRDALEAEFRRVRQESITAEIVELSASGIDPAAAPSC